MFAWLSLLSPHFFSKTLRSEINQTLQKQLFQALQRDIERVYAPLGIDAVRPSALQLGFSEAFFSASSGALNSSRFLSLEHLVSDEQVQLDGVTRGLDAFLTEWYDVIRPKLQRRVQLLRDVAFDQNYEHGIFSSADAIRVSSMAYLPRLNTAMLTLHALVFTSKRCWLPFSQTPPLVSVVRWQHTESLDGHCALPSGGERRIPLQSASQQALFG